MLRFRLILLVLLSLLPGLGLSLYQSRQQRQHLKVDAQSLAVQLTHLTASNHDQLLVGTRQLLLTLAELPQVRSRDPATCSALFAKLLKQYPLYANLGAVDTNGDWFCSAVPLEKRVNAADRSWFRLAMQTQDFAVGDYQIGQITGKSTVKLAYPVLNDQRKVEAVVVAALDSDQLNQIAAASQLPKGAVIDVIDRNGTIVASYPDPDKWVGKFFPKSPLIKTILSQKQGIADIPGVDGIDRLYAFKPLNGELVGRDKVAPPRAADSSLYLTIGIPKDVAFAEVNQALIRNLTGLGLMMLVMLTAAWFGSDLLVLRQVKALLKTTRRFAAGDLSARTDIQDQPGELNQLARAFDDMAESLERQMQERQLREQERRELNTALSNAVEGIARLDPQGRYISVNNAYARIAGYPPEEMIGMQWTASVHPEDQERMIAAYQQLLNNGKVDVETRGIRQDGSIFYKQVVMLATKDKEQQFSGHYCFMKDISDRKAAELALAYSEQQYRTLAQNFPNGAVLLFDHELRYTLADGAGLAVVGLSKEFLEGKTIWQAFPPKISEILEPIYRQTLAGGAISSEIPFAKHTYLVYTVPIKNEQGEVLGGMSATQDITERKRAERELCQLKEELEARVQERTAELMAANEQLQHQVAVRLKAEKMLSESQVCLKVINTISTGITSGMQPLQIIERIITQLSQHFKDLRVAYSIIDEQGILTVIEAIAPPGMPPLQGSVIDLTAAPDYLSALHRNQPQIIADISADLKLKPLASVMLASGTKAVLDVPLYRSTDGLVGLLRFDSPEPRQWSPYEAATLIEVADYLSITLKEAQTQQERTKAEAALRESEERYRLLVELSPETILVQSEEKIAYINPAGIQLLGATTVEELIGTSLLTRVHPNYREFVQTRIQQVQQEGEQIPLAEIQMVRFDGQVIDVESMGVRIVYQGKPAVQVLIRDITDRKHTQEVLEQYTAQVWDLYNNAPCGYHSLDKNGTFISINNTELQWLGYSQDEVIGKLKFSDLLTPESSKTFEKSFSLFKERGWINDLEFQLVRKDSSILPVILSATAITDEEGHFVTSRSTVFDITERKGAEAELQAQAQLLNLAHDTIMVRDTNDRIIFWNQGAVEMYGYTRAEALGKQVCTLLQTQFPQPLEDIEAQLIRDGRWDGELTQTRADGSRIMVASRWALQRDEYGIPIRILEINNDITERVQAEQELQQSETMLRSFCEVTAAVQLNLNKRLHNMLAIGCQHFNLDFGLLAHVQGDRYEILAAQTPDHSVAVGDLFDVNQAYCLEALLMPEPLCIEHASASEWCHHPGYAGFRMETYIGMRVLVNNNVYGMLCFCSHVPSSRPFNSVDKELLKLMTQWIGSEIERYSAAKALERLQHQNELILNSAGEGICGVDSQGNITFVNPATAKMLGYRVAELINQPIQAMLCQLQQEETPQSLDQAFLDAVFKDGIVQHFKDQVFCRKDGSSFPVEGIATPMQEGKVTEQGSASQMPESAEDSPLAIVGAVIIFRDITERRAIERMKDEFISVVSHELRTPLTSIRGALGLIAGGLLTTQPDKAQRMLEIAAGNTDRLTRLINDILDIERIESGKVQMEKEVCNAYDLMVQTADEMRPMAEKTGITLVVAPIEAQLLVDRDRIVQVLTNLISNAIKFSPPNTTIAVAAKLVRNEELAEHPTPPFSNQCSLLVTVKDQGRGIPADKLETIFGRFQQVNASDSRDKGGTGLGLAICRSIVQQHGGRIWVESHLGEGSTFYFTLPALPSSNQALEKSSCDCSLDDPPPPLVLLCDDDTSIHPVIQIILEDRGYRVVTVANGQEAVQQAALLQPAVILLDLMMPDMDGWATTAMLKEQPETKNIPIIIFSALMLEAGEFPPADVVGWLSKPLTSEALYESIEQSLKQWTKVTRILVVEDDLDLARVLTTMFERHGIEAYHAETGQQAIQLSQRLLPNLLLLDLVLPEGDGYAVAEWLRLHDHLCKVPLVVYSAKDLNKAERDRLALGPTEFFTKGRTTPEEFEERVIALLNRIVPKP